MIDDVFITDSHDWFHKFKVFLVQTGPRLNTCRFSELSWDRLHFISTFFFMAAFHELVLSDAQLGFVLIVLHCSVLSDVTLIILQCNGFHFLSFHLESVKINVKYIGECLVPVTSTSPHSVASYFVDNMQHAVE